MHRLLVAILIVGLMPAAMADKVYKWTGPDGKVHYSNTPPGRDVRAREVPLVIPSFGGEAKVSTAAGVGRGVRIYTTASCGYCKRALAHLRKRSVPFTEYDVQKNITGKLDYQRLKGRGVPIILVGNQRMDGYSEPRLEEMLRKAGY